MPTLPNGIKPIINPGGYSFNGPGGVERTQVAGGANRYALDWSRGVQRFEIAFLLEELEFSVWEGFYHNLIDKGAIQFDMPLDSGFGTSTHSVNIIPGTYSVAKTASNIFSVRFAVEAESQSYQLGEDGAQALLDIYNDVGKSSPALLDRLAIFANEDTDVLDY